MADENNVNHQANDTSTTIREAIIRQRASIRQRLDRWIAFVDLPEFAAMDLFAVQTRMERGRALMKQMEDKQLDTVAAIVDANAVEQYGTEFMELEERYYEASARLNRRMGELERQQAPAVNPEQPEQRIKVHIPAQQTDIRNTWGNFDGSLLQWKEFKDRFIAAIHNNKDVDPVFKFSYLKKSLRGPAADSLKGYDVTEANYNVAWERLNKEYDRKYPLAREYLRQFFSLKAVGVPATVEELRRLSNVTMETRRNLESLGYPVNEWNIIFVHVLHGLLNHQLACEWGLELLKLDDNPTTEQMVAFLDKHVNAAASTNQPQPNIIINVNNDTNQNRQGYAKEKAARPTSSTGSNQASNQGAAAEPWRFPCGSCGGNHKIFYCPEFSQLTYKGRVQQVLKKKLCVLCLKRGHSIDACYDLSRCSHKKCKDDGLTKHNSLLCENQCRDKGMYSVVDDNRNSHRSNSRKRNSSKDSSDRAERSD